MDLLSILRRVWRHKLVTVPVIALTWLAVAYVAVTAKPQYQAAASYVLINPLPPPTAQEIAARPALAKVHADNPYVRFYDLEIVADAVSRTMSTETAARRLVRAGAGPVYSVASLAPGGTTHPLV